MPKMLRSLIALAAFAGAPSLAHAGWVLQWTTTATNSKGERMASQQATQSISENRVRMEQPEVVTIADYGQGRITMLNPVRQYFWSGTVEEYVRDMTRARETAMREKIGSMTGKKVGDDAAAAAPTPRTIDPEKLPPVSIVPTGTSEEIAGYEAVKYEVRVDGELFEEMWVAPLDLSSDLDFDRFLAQQVTNSAAMQGKSGEAYSALYRSPEYRRVVDKHTVLKNVTHHLAGKFERDVTSVAQRDIPASTFAVPESYRKVRLNDLLAPPPEAPAPSSPSGSGQDN